MRLSDYGVQLQQYQLSTPGRSGWHEWQYLQGVCTRAKAEIQQWRQPGNLFILVHIHVVQKNIKHIRKIECVPYQTHTQKQHGNHAA